MTQPLTIFLIALFIVGTGPVGAWSPPDPAGEARLCRSMVAGDEDQQQSEPAENALDEKEPDCE